MESKKIFSLFITNQYIISVYPNLLHLNFNYVPYSEICSMLLKWEEIEYVQSIEVQINKLY